MNYPYYQSDPSGWGNNQSQISRPPTIRFQPQPSWEGIDYFKAYAPNIDPLIFNQVYGNIFNAGPTIHSLGVSIHEARIWHQRVYGNLGIINTVTPQEIGYASAYEAYRIWIHNSTLHEPLAGERDRQREALIGLAVAEAGRMYMTARPGDAHGRVPACEAAAATASIIFDQSLMDGPENIGVGMGYNAGMGYSAGTGHNTNMSTGAYGSGFGMPGMAGTGMSTGVDPYIIDYEAPYFRQRMGRHRRLSTPGGGMYGASRGYSPGAGIGRVGTQGSPYLGTGPEMNMGMNPANRSPMLGAYGGRSPVPSAYGGVSPIVSSIPSNGGVSPINASPMNRVSPANVTTVPAYPGATTIIQLPRKHRHLHHTRRARSAESLDVAYKAGGPLGGAVGGIAGGAAGMMGGAVGGLARGEERGAMAGARVAAWPGTTRASPAYASGPMGVGMGGYHPGGPSTGYGYPGYNIYRY